MLEAVARLTACENHYRDGRFVLEITARLAISNTWGMITIRLEIIVLMIIPRKCYPYFVKSSWKRQ